MKDQFFRNIPENGRKGTNFQHIVLKNINLNNASIVKIIGIYSTTMHDLTVLVRSSVSFLVFKHFYLRTVYTIF